MAMVRKTGLLAVAALCAGLLVPVVAAAPAAAGTNGCPPGGDFYGVAHQGAHDRADGSTTWRNTVPAFQKAQDRCQWVETDIRFTKDMIPVMVHDKTTGPMFRQRCNLVVAEHTLAELRAACRNPDGSTVATFDDFLDVVSLGGMVEIKAGQTSDKKLQIMIDKIYAHGDADVVSLKHTEEWVLQRVAALDNDANPILRTWKGALVGYPDLVAATCDYAVFNYTKFTADVVGRLKVRGVLSFSSVGSTDAVANRPAAWARLAAMGAAGAQTDYSKELFDWQNSR